MWKGGEAVGGEFGGLFGDRMQIWIHIKNDKWATKLVPKNN